MSRPRIRTVKPEMRQDERYAKLSYPARELFNGLITMADDEGRFRAPTAAILGHVFPYDEDATRKLRDWVSEIRESGMVLFYINDGVPYGAFRHWRRHQKVNRPNPSVLPPPPNLAVVTENSVNESGSDHDSITDGSRSHAQVRVPIRSSSTDNGEGEGQDHARSLCRLLADLIVARDPKMRQKVQPASAGWLRDVRLLIERDERDPAEIERAIRWSQASSFWAPNIMSPAKLRKQFPVIWGQMQRDSAPAASSHLPENLRVSPEHQAQLEAHIKDPGPEPEWLQGATERMQADLAKRRAAG